MAEVHPSAIVYPGTVLIIEPFRKTAAWWKRTATPNPHYYDPEQFPLELRTTARFWMLIIPDGQFVPRERMVITLNRRFFEAEFEMAVQPGVEGRARHAIIVVREMFAAAEQDIIRRAEH